MSSEADWIHLVTRVVEIVGTAIIVVGSFGALVTFLLRLATHAGRGTRWWRPSAPISAARSC
jgi:hypothetical protein